MDFDNTFLKQFENNYNTYYFKFVNDDNSDCFFERNNSSKIKLISEFNDKELYIFFLILEEKKNIKFIDLLADLLGINKLQYLLIYNRYDNIFDVKNSSYCFVPNHILLIQSLENIEDLISKLNKQFINSSLKLMEYKQKIKILFKLYNTEYYLKIIEKDIKIDDNNELLLIQKIKEDIEILSILGYNNKFQLNENIKNNLLMCFQNSKSFIQNFLDNNTIFKELEIFLCKLLNLDKAKDFLPTEFIISSLKDKMLQCLNIINIKYFYKYFISLLRQRIEFKVLDSISEKLVKNENKI